MIFVGQSLTLSLSDEMNILRLKAVAAADYDDDDDRYYPLTKSEDPIII